MRKVAVLVPLVLFLLLAGAPAVAITPSPSQETVVPLFIGTWIVTQGSMLPDGTPIPYEVYSVPELLHIDMNGEIRALSGLFHANSLGTVWPIVPGRTLVVPVNASMGIGDWGYDYAASVVAFSYYGFLYGADGKPVGIFRVTRTLALQGGDPPPIDVPPGGPGREDQSLSAGTADEWSGMTIMRFYDLLGQPLYLPLVAGAPPVAGVGGPFRAVRASM